MNIEFKGFIIPHNEEPYYTCADRYAIDLNTKSIAIADGVGGSLYPSFLSERITKDFVANPVGLFDETSHSLNKDYSTEFDTYYRCRYNELPPAKQQILDLKVEQTKTSSCTFVGCRVIDKCLKYYALGDSYLFFIANDGTMKKISSMEGKEFDVFPEYFSTSGKHNGILKIGEISLQNGVLLMMTDALSDWFIKYYEEDKSILSKILALDSHKKYKDFCNIELATGRLHDDDCTLIIAKIENADIPEVTFSISHMDSIADLSERELKDLVQTKESERTNAISQRDVFQSNLTDAEAEIEKLNMKVTERDEGIKKLIVDTITVKLDEVRKSDDKFLKDIEIKINKIMTENSTFLNNIQQDLNNLKKDIDSKLQYVNSKEDTNTNPNSVCITSKNESESEKKKNGSLSKNSNLLLNSIIIVLLILIFIFK